MLSYGVIMIAGLVLAGLLAMDGAMVGSLPAFALAPGVLAMLGFLTRDVAVFVLMRGLAGAKGDFAALALLAALYLVLPAALHRAGLDLKFLLIPVAGSAAIFGVLSAWIQTLAAMLWATRSIKRLD